MSAIGDLTLWTLTTGIAVAVRFSCKWQRFHQWLLPWTGGVLVGLSFFWVLPDLAEGAGWAVSLIGISAGVTLLLLFDRYIYPVCPFCALAVRPGCNDDVVHARIAYFGAGWPLLIAGCIHNFFDGWVIGLARAGGSGSVSSPIFWGFAVHKIPEAFAIGLLASAFTPGPALGLGVILLVQSAFAAGGVVVLIAHAVNPEVIDVCIGGAGATLLFFGLSALHAEWRLRGAIPALRVGTVGIITCGLAAFVVRFIGG